MERLRGAKAPRFCKAVVRDSGQGPADLSMIVISNSGSHAEAWNGADGLSSGTTNSSRHIQGEGLVTKIGKKLSKTESRAEQIVSNSISSARVNATKNTDSMTMETLWRELPSHARKELGRKFEASDLAHIKIRRPTFKESNNMVMKGFRGYYSSSRNEIVLRDRIFNQLVESITQGKGTSQMGRQNKKTLYEEVFHAAQADDFAESAYGKSISKDISKHALQAELLLAIFMSKSEFQNREIDIERQAKTFAWTTTLRQEKDDSGLVGWSESKIKSLGAGQAISEMEKKRDLYMSYSANKFSTYHRIFRQKSWLDDISYFYPWPP